MSFASPTPTTVTQESVLPTQPQQPPQERSRRMAKKTVTFQTDIIYIPSSISFAANINNIEDNDNAENADKAAATRCLWYTRKEICRMRMRDRVLVQMARQNRCQPRRSGGGGGDAPHAPILTNHENNHTDDEEEEEVKKDVDDEEEGCTDSLLGLESIIAVDGNKSEAQRSRNVVFQEQERQKQQHKQQEQETPVATVDPELIALVYAAAAGRAARKAHRRARDLARSVHPRTGSGRRSGRRREGGKDDIPVPPPSPPPKLVPQSPFMRNNNNNNNNTSPKKRSSLSPCRRTSFSTRKIADGAQLSPKAGCSPKASRSSKSPWLSSSAFSPSSKKSPPSPSSPPTSLLVRKTLTPKLPNMIIISNTTY